VTETDLVLGEPHGVYLVDLASYSAGDDWGFINRLLAMTDEPDEGQPRHLMVIDAIEGLEVLAGERDVFGEERPRRSRVAQLLRTAREKFHLVFIAEEPVDGARVPEEFVTDVVLRLSYQKDRDYLRRTLEI
jgi:hypothetical protein